MYKRLTVYTATMVAVAAAFFSFATQAHAQINVEVNREYTVSETGEMEVLEQELLTNNYRDRFIPGDASRRYDFVISAQDNKEREQIANIIYNSLTLKLNGSISSFAKVNQRDAGSGLYQYGITYKFRNRLNPGNRMAIDISYKHPELAEKSGGLLDSYIPAFADNFQFNLADSKYTYRTRLKVPSSSGVESVVSVDPVSTFSEGAYDVYVFDQESLRGKFVWVQRGSKQVYKFRLTQELEATQQRATGNINEYQIILPRSIDEVNINQKVYYQKISPEPVAINTDPEGNLLGIFRTNAEQKLEVVLEGFAVITAVKNDLKQAGNFGQLEAKSQSMSRYLQPAEYWEVDSPKIQAAAKEVGQSEEVYDVLSDLYKYVIDRIDYSQVKRFGINERKGALATLEGGAAVCMEYSDLYLSLLRVRGIPTRAVFGYGYNSRVSADAQEPHQWVQAYLPGFDKWVSIDVTWGENGQQLIGGDLNHFYTHVAAVDPNSPPVLSRLALGTTSSELKGPKYEIEAMANIPSNIKQDDLLSEEALLAKYPSRETGDSSYFADALKMKFLSSLQNLVTAPGNIDTQGWLLLGAAIGISVLVISFIYRVVHLLRGRPKRKRYKEV